MLPEIFASSNFLTCKISEHAAMHHRSGITRLLPLPPNRGALA